MPNPVPEKRVGLALLFIGVISLYIFMLSVWAGNSASPWALAVIALVLWAGWRLRERFKSWGVPPPQEPPKPAGPAKAPGKAAPRKGGFGLPFGRKPAPPPPPPPPAPPPKSGPLGFLWPRAKGPPKK